MFVSKAVTGQQQNVVHSVQEKSVRQDFSQLISVASEDVRSKRLKQVIANLDECSSDDLNYLVVELLTAMGFMGKITDGFQDGGVDVIGFEDGKMKIAIQCKAWNPKKNTKRISMKEVQAFKGSFLTKYEYGIFITTHYFTDPCWKEESANYYLIDRKKLFPLLARYFPQQISNALYFESLESLPKCPKCNSGKMLNLWAEAKDGRKGYIYKWCESCEENSYM